MAKKKVESKKTKIKKIAPPVYLKKYKCTGCGLEFEKDKTGTGTISCPDCGKTASRIG